ncbi:MAG: DNA mismatch repair endonuclease MutL [Planctomycetota bacterium]
MGSQCRIRILPDLLVNKIAAGEVVERPASVVKELMENAIDAGPTRIAITVEEGGARLIRVTDDGCGMTAEELRLAIMPHATSKLVAEEDLYTISTMGFRGEALASIAAVSQLRIVSRVRGAVEGHEVRMAGDRYESAGAAACPEGATVEVRELFFNVPARRKFLRSSSTETGHINDQFIRVALAYPRVGFELSSNGRTTQNLPASDDRLPRIAKFYGPELAEALLPITRDERGLHIEAYVAPPAQARATPQWQYVFVNGRYIRDRFVQHAIREAYRGLMEPSRHGVVFLFLTLDPARLDVNVHPTKIEVRWADSNLIHSQVLSALRETLQRADLTPRLRTDRAAAASSPLDEAEQDRIRHELASVLKATPPIHSPGRSGDGYAGAGPPADSPRWQPSAAPSPGSTRWGTPLEAWRSLYGIGPDDSTPTQPDPQYSCPAVSPPGVNAEAPARVNAGAVTRAIQMHNLYLVAETEDGIVIVDQHALHERVMYEQLRARLTTGSLESQRLLLPETISVTPQQAALLESNAELLTRLGIEVTPFGADSVAVHAFPALLKDLDVAPFMRDLLDRLGGQAGPAHTEGVVHEILDMMACKAAVKAGDPLSDVEIEALLRQRHLIEKSSSCPHGRPTTLRLTKADLNRQFKRT